MRTAAIVVLAGAIGLTGACGPEAECDCAEDGCSADRCSKTVFLTRTQVKGDFGGITAADDICAQEAEEAGLAGTFLAWLSDPAQSPERRFSAATAPYVLSDGTEVAASWEALVEDGPSTGIFQFADSTEIAADATMRVWTATFDEGNPDLINTSSFCGGWTSHASDERVLTGVIARELGAWGWTSATMLACSNAANLYCFQQ